MSSFGERSAGFVVFHRTGRKILFLLLRSGRDDFWGIPKGHVESDETDLEAAYRELLEETGIDSKNIILGFEEKIHYELKRNSKTISKEVVYFLLKVTDINVILSSEHSEFIWTDAAGAVQLIAFDNLREVIKKADTFIIASAC
ncbi:MAG: bis(5'-nucleosyl)-tetraphosphatase [Planctomycetota bacterium]